MNILISSLYEISDPIISTAVKYSVNKIILFKQKNSDKRLDSSISKLKTTFKKPNFELEFKTIDVYDLYSIASNFVDVIDSLPKSNKIFVNITGGRKTLSLGLLFGVYARSNRIKEVIYVTEEDGTFVVLPKLDFDLSDSERKVLGYINTCNKTNCDLVITKLSDDVCLSRAMVYKVLTELENRNYITSDKDNKFVLTDAGKIVLL